MALAKQCCFKLRVHTGVWLLLVTLDQVVSLSGVVGGQVASSGACRGTQLLLAPIWWINIVDGYLLLEYCHVIPLAIDGRGRIFQETRGRIM